VPDLNCGEQQPDIRRCNTFHPRNPTLDSNVVVGVGLPLAALEIAAAEFDRSHTKVKFLETWTTYLLMIVSWALFFIAAWRLPTLIISGFRV
jgi:hypothetical protein